MSQMVLSTHVLDISTGGPVGGMFVELFKKREDLWTQWHTTVTSNNGRIQFPFSHESMLPGTYKLKFHIEDYYKINNKETLYPYVEIVFNTKEENHYHIPLLLSPYGYSTYRGMFVEFMKKKEDSWMQWHTTVTSNDGRIELPFPQLLMVAGTYRLKFHVEDYFKRTNTETLYPFIEIVFNVKEEKHYHIPLLLSPYGYSTYRGS